MKKNINELSARERIKKIERFERLKWIIVCAIILIIFLGLIATYIIVAIQRSNSNNEIAGTSSIVTDEIDMEKLANEVISHSMQNYPGKFSLSHISQIIEKSYNANETGFTIQDFKSMKVIENIKDDILKYEVKIGNEQMVSWKYEPLEFAELTFTNEIPVNDAQLEFINNARLKVETMINGLPNIFDNPENIISELRKVEVKCVEFCDDYKYASAAYRDGCIYINSKMTNITEFTIVHEMIHAVSNITNPDISNFKKSYINEILTDLLTITCEPYDSQTAHMWSAYGNYYNQIAFLFKVFGEETMLKYYFYADTAAIESKVGNQFEIFVKTFDGSTFDFNAWIINSVLAAKWKML